MNAPVSHDTLAAVSPELAMVTLGFGNLQQFEFLQRAANCLTQSTLVPAPYRRWNPKTARRDCTEFVENQNAIPNAMVALNMSQRMRADVLMVMQNLNIIEGKPSWSSTFIIAMINTCGRFSTLRYRITDLGEQPMTYNEVKWEGPSGNREKKYYPKEVRLRNLSCVAFCTDIATGETLESPAISIQMAVAENWYGRDGSKWQTMPELMLHYRSAAFFGRLYAPELLMGLRTADELVDMGMLHQSPDGAYVPDGDVPPLSPNGTGAPQSAATTDRPTRPQAKPAAAATSPQGPIDQSTGEIGATASAPSPAPAATPAPSPAPTPAPAPVQEAAAAPASPVCSEGSRKFLLKKFAAHPEALLPALQAAGYTRLDAATPEQIRTIVDKVDAAALDRLTEDQFTAVKARIPR